MFTECLLGARQLLSEQVPHLPQPEPFSHYFFPLWGFMDNFICRKFPIAKISNALDSRLETVSYK